MVIPAHDTEIGAIAVNVEGTLIASASERGHIIKIFSTDGGEVVQELKRGNSKAEINGILFHPTQYILACTSSKTSIHIFEIKKAVEKCIQTNQFGFSSGDLDKNVEAKNTKSGL
jgi:WD40 repeat protein